jgi:hypothetical protein
MAKQTFTAGQVLTAAQVNGLQTNDFNLTVSTKTAAYTFVVGDRGTRVVLNDTTARTFTIDDSIFSAGDTIQVHNINTGVLTIAAGSGVTLNGADVLTLAQWQGGTIYFTSASSAIFFPTAKTVASGLAVVKAETSFSAASSVTADSVFSSTYTNYLVVVRYSTSTTNLTFFKLRASGTSASTNYDVQTLSAADTTVSGARLTAQTSAVFGFYTNSATEKYTTNIWLTGPNLAEPTAWHSEASGTVGSNAALSYYVGGNHRTATAHDGIELLVASGNMTGTYTIYGLAKS